MMIDTTTKGADLPPSNTKRESDDAYQGVIYTAKNWRVCTCKDNRQWIIQKAEISPRGRVWRGVGYVATRKALVRLWHLKTGDYNGTVSLVHLPEQIGGAV